MRRSTNNPRSRIYLHLLLVICHPTFALLASIFSPPNLMRRVLVFTAIVVCQWALTIEAQQPASREIEQHQGIWLASSFRRDGQETPQEIVRTITRTVVGDHVVWKRNGKDFAGTALVLDPRQSPKAIDVIADGGPTRGKRVLGIYRLDNNRLTICMADADQPRPKNFMAEKGSRQTLMVFTREKPQAKE
jgi:uncharacterized protein (TIGR03067 family)